MWGTKVVAEAERDELIYIEGNWYFPPDKVKMDFLRPSSTPYTCPWKGECSYFDVGKDDDWARDSAWTYKKPLASSIDIVKRDYAHYVAFWRGVEVGE